MVIKACERDLFIPFIFLHIFIIYSYLHFYLFIYFFYFWGGGGRLSKHIHGLVFCPGMTDLVMIQFVLGNVLNKFINHEK